MWVSGSLIRSSTWRSSSVSAPCISSSICLPSSPREVAHDAGQLLPGVADRLHPRLHDAFLQLGGDVGEPLQRHLELGVLVAAGDLQKLVAGQHQLGDHGHQMFERVDVDADRLVGDLVGFLDVGGLGRWQPSCGLASFLAAASGAGAGCGLGDGRGLATGAGATSISVSRKARSRSSSETSPGRSGRSSTCSTSVPCATAGAAGATGGAATTGAGSALQPRHRHRLTLPPCRARPCRAA